MGGLRHGGYFFCNWLTVLLSTLVAQVGAACAMCIVASPESHCPAASLSLLPLQLYIGRLMRPMRAETSLAFVPLFGRPWACLLVPP